MTLWQTGHEEDDSCGQLHTTFSWCYKNNRPPADIQSGGMDRASTVAYLYPAHANLSENTQSNALSAAPSLGLAGLNSRPFRQKKNKINTSRTVTKYSNKMLCQRVPFTVTCCVCLSGATMPLSQCATSSRMSNILVSSHHSSTRPPWGKLSSSQWVIRSEKTIANRWRQRPQNKKNKKTF